MTSSSPIFQNWSFFLAEQHLKRKNLKKKWSKNNSPISRKCSRTLSGHYHVLKHVRYIFEIPSNWMNSAAQTALAWDVYYFRNGQPYVPSFRFLTSFCWLDGVHFRCDFQDLGHPWTDWDETLGVYRVDLEIMQRHIFDFRSEVQTGNGPFYPWNRYYFGIKFYSEL